MRNLQDITGRMANQIFQFCYIYSKFRDGEIEDIYVQDYTYFDKYRDEIQKIFGSGINSIDYVAIHVRRGDYINNPFYVDLWETDYYEKAIAEFPNERFMIFSDDIEWCKENFIGKEYSFNEDEIDYEAMNTMASCKAIICANSSFSWMAAYIGNVKKVIIPEQWFSDGIERVISPPEWKKI